MPNDEQYLISAVLRGRDFTAAGDLEPEHFGTHKAEWEWLTKYFEDYHRVPSRAAFVAQFEDFHVATCDDVEHFATQVRRGFARRKMYGAMRRATEEITNGDLDSAMLRMQQTITDTANSLGTAADTDIFKDPDDVLRDVSATALRIAETGSAGIPTGFESWDEATGGLKPGELVIVGARLGAGKSWTLMRMAQEAVIKGHTVLYDSLEMTRTQVTLRVQTLMSSAYGQGLVQASSYMTGRNKPDMVSYRKLVKELRKVQGRMHVVDARRGQMSAMTISAQIERHKPDVVFIDYLTLLKMSGDGDWRSIGGLTHELQSMSQRYNVPIVAAAQLNRADGVTRRSVPGVEAIGQSDMIAQDAAQVMNFKRISERTGVMRLVKNRHGRDDISWWTEFRPGEGVIKEVSTQYGKDLADEDADKADER